MTSIKMLCRAFLAIALLFCCGTAFAQLSMTGAGGGASGGAGGGGSTPLTYSAWDPTVNPSSIIYSNNNTTAALNGTNAGVADTAYGHSGADKVYLEATPVLGGSECCFVLGISPAAYQPSNAEPSGYINSGLTGTVAFQFDTTAGLHISGVSETFSPPIASGVAIGIAIDFGAQKIWIREGCGTWEGTAGDNPSTGTGGYAYSPGAPAYISATMAYQPTTDTLTLNTGGTAFACAAPTGFAAWH